MYCYQNLINIISILDIKKPSLVAQKILDNNNDLFVANYVNNVQIGGDEGIRTFSIKFNKYTFNVKFIDHGDRLSYAVETKSRKTCLLIFIDKQNPNYLANIHNISYYSDCVVEGLEYPGGGSVMLKFALYFLQKHKKKFNINRVTLMDNAYKTCKGGTINIAIMHTLLFGKTWYAKYGFKPYVPNTNSIDKLKLNELDKNEKKMKTILVKDLPNLKKYINEAYEKIKDKSIPIKLINKLIEIMQDKLLTNFLQLLLLDYDINCAIFLEIFEKLMIKLKLSSVQRVSYYLDI
jgi:hypothetical protein